MKFKLLAIMLLLTGGFLTPQASTPPIATGQEAAEQGVADGTQVELPERPGNLSRQERIDFLLSVLENAREHIQTTLRELQGRGVKVPDSAIERVESGLRKAGEAISKRDAGDFEAATRALLEALRDHRLAGQDLEKSTARLVTERSGVEAEEAIVLGATVKRLRQTIERLEDIAGKKEARGEDASNIRETIARAEERLARAEQRLNRGEVREAGRIVSAEQEGEDIDNELKGILKHELEEIAEGEKPDRVREFLDKATDRILKLREDLANLSLPVEIRRAIAESLNNALTRIDQARRQIDSKQVDIAIETLEEAVERETDTLREAEKSDRGKVFGKIKSLQSSIENSQARLERLAKDGLAIPEEVTNMIEKAASILREASEKLQTGLRTDAEELIEQVEDLLDRLEQSVERLQEQHKFREELQKRLIKVARTLRQLEKKLVELKERFPNAPEERFSILESKLREVREFLRRVESGAERTSIGQLKEIAEVFDTVEEAIERLTERLGERTKEDETGES